MKRILQAAASLARPMFLRWARRRLPDHRGRFEVPGLAAPVQVHRDRWGIPHIQATTRLDASFAAGFVHAQDRLWQMELTRRVTRGELAALFGEVALDTDRLTRTLGFVRKAIEVEKVLPGTARAGLEAYAAGVNACMELQPLPVEFSLTGHRPRPWQPLDTLVQGRFLVWSMSHAWLGPILRAKLLESLGEEMFREIDIRYPEVHPAILPAGIDVRRLDPESRLVQAAMDPALTSGPAGSNSWVVPPDRSTTGRAILANDMHLELRVPSIWYLIHMECPAEDFRVIGSSIPGMPVVLVGHNADIGWGATLGFADQQDVFVERLHPEDPDRYETPAGFARFDVVMEEIEVKGRAMPHREPVRVSRHGPVLDRVLECGGQVMSLRSVPLEDVFSLEGFLDLQDAKNWDDFSRAAAKLEAPPLNLVYVDREDNIGYRLTSKVPVRASGQGRFPCPGWTDDHEWIGRVPIEEMPHLLNPAHGFIVTANHRVVTDDYPHYLGASWMNGYRARRIESVLGSLARVSPDDCRRLQMDVHSLAADELLPLIADHRPVEPRLGALFGTLLAWDRELGIDSVGGTLYEALVLMMIENLLRGAGAEALVEEWAGKGPHPVILANTEFYGHAVCGLIRVLRDPGSPILARCGGRDALIARSLAAAGDELTARLGPDPATWTWGRLHQATFLHAMGREPALAPLFNVPPVPVGGDTDTVHQTASLVQEPFLNNNYSPGYRQVLRPDDWSRSGFITVPGQSGHPASPHYGDLVEPWRKGELLPMLWERDEVLAASVDLLELVPRRLGPSGP